MRKINFKVAIPYVSAIAIFLIIAVIYFRPAFEGKVLQQNDVMQGTAAQQEVLKYQDETEERSLWTNSMFGGMPMYQIGMKVFSNYLVKIRQIIELWMPRPAAIFMLFSIGFFILMLSFGINPWISIIGALAFSFSTYHFVLLEAGHIWKLRTLAFMPPTLAGFILLHRKKYKIGLVTILIFLTFQFHSNHLQMTYYFFLLVGLLFIFFIWNAYQNKDFKHLGIIIATTLIALVVSIGINFTTIYTTYEYGIYSQRGKSELMQETDENYTGGLERDYITQWSYGIGESFSILIPNVKGGGSGYIGNNEKALENVDPRFKEQISQSSKYWGNQLFMGGPDFYFGAFVIFLFALGMFLLKDKLKWVFFGGFVFSIMLSWGRNFPGLTNFFIDYFPLYNKFRVVASILVIAGLCTPILAIFTLSKVANEPTLITKNKKKFYYAFAFTGGFLLLFYLLPETFFSFLSDRETEYFNSLKNSNPQQSAVINQYISNLEAARISIFKTDTIRSFFFILIGTIGLYLYAQKKFSKNVLILGAGLLIVIDLWAVNARYVNHDTFVTQRKSQEKVQPSVADQAILNDTSHYRVLNVAVSPFQDATTSYYHKSVGGYHGAKLMIYKELIDFQLSQEISLIQQGFQQKNITQSSINTLFKETETLNMLATKYIIYNPSSPPIKNPYAQPPAWFVSNIKQASSPVEEIKGLDEINIPETALVRETFNDYVEGLKFNTSNDSTSHIKLIDYKPNHLKYKSSAAEEKFAVFSEIYYPEGWRAFIDDNEVDFIRTNYVLRGMKIPAGEHTIEFKFKPKSYFIGQTVSKVSSAVLLIIILGAIAVNFLKK